MVSRTMRAPADALLGLSGLLRAGALLPTQRGYVDALQQAGESLRGILNEVSDFSRLESGVLALEPIGFDPRLMVDDLVAALQAEAGPAGVTLRTQWEGPVPRRVSGDPGRIRQIFAALVRDGLARATGEGVLTLRLDFRAGSPGVLCAEVEDSGSAIPADLLPTLFEPFLRADAGPHRLGGSELGLPIARQLARLMGGDLTVTSAAATRFTVRLPLPAAPDDGSSDEVAEAGAGRGREPDAAAARGSDTVLVVEHDGSQRAAWSCLVEAAGYRAIGTRDPAGARDELRRLAQDSRPVAIVLFSDHDAEGYETIGRIISDDADLERPALLMLPAVGNPGDVRRLKAAGFRGYLVKPVEPPDLREALELFRRTPRARWHTLFVTRHALAEMRTSR
jgi:CheY-like chemotaxis protein